MARRKSTILNMVLVLFIVTSVAATSLGYVYEATKEPIAKAKADKLKRLINVVVPGASEAEIEKKIIMPSTGKDSLTFYIVKKEDKVLGTAIETYTDKGFSGRMWVMMGLNSEGIIIDTDVLEHKETPGLGNKTAKNVSEWNKQFANKDPRTFKLTVKKDGGNVDAITAATISSRAYCDALQRGYDAFIIQNNEGGN